MAELLRHSQGRKRFARILNLWFEQSMLDTDGSAAMKQFCRAAELVLESNRLHATQLSGLITGTQKQISIYTFEAFGAVSEAAAFYHRPEMHFPQREKLQRVIIGNTRLCAILMQIPPILHLNDWADHRSFIDLFLGINDYAYWELQKHWNKQDWAMQLSLLTDAPESTTVIADGSLGQGLRNLLAAVPGDISTKVAELIGLYPDSVSLERLQKIKMVAFNLPGDDEFTPEEEELEAMSLSTALTLLCKQPISVNDIKKAAQISPIVSATNQAAVS